MPGWNLAVENPRNSSAQSAPGLTISRILLGILRSGWFRLHLGAPLHVPAIPSWSARKSVPEAHGQHIFLLISFFCR